MGNVAAISGRESVDDNDFDGPPGGLCNISEFEHAFSASLEDASGGVIPDSLEECTPSTGLRATLRGRGSRDNTSLNAPLVGRLVTAHMLETELTLSEAVGLAEQTLATIPYASIRRLTWDHSQSSLKIGFGPAAALNSEQRDEAAVSGSTGNKIVRTGDIGDPDAVFVSIRVENSLELEDELKQRARAETRRALASGQTSPQRPASVYLGMFAGVTKPKPFQRKRPNLSFTVPEGELPSLQVTGFFVLSRQSWCGNDAMVIALAFTRLFCWECAL